MNNIPATYQKIVNRLAATRRRESILNLYTGFMKVIANTALALLTVVAIEYFFHGDVAMRTVLAGLVFVVAVGSAGFFLVPPLLRAFGIRYLPQLEQVALRVGDVYPEIKDRLCNAIQLASGLERGYGTSGELALAAFNQTYAEVENKDFNKIIDKKEFRNTFYYFLIALAFSVGTFLMFRPALGDALFRVSHFTQSFVPPSPFTIEIDPLEARHIRGESAVIYVRTTGTPPQTVTLNLKEEQQENYDQFPLKLDTNGVYKYEISSVRRSLSFFAAADWMGSKITTETGRINVVDKPMIRAISGSIAYPGYTGLVPRRFDEQSADISALTGSRVRLEANANKELRSAEIVFIARSETQAGDSVVVKTDTSRIPLEVADRTASGGFTVRNSGIYYINITGKNGESNDNPIRYAVSALTDAHPTITLLQPTMNVQVSEEAILPIKVAISDDYGFSKLLLHYRLNFSAYTSPDEKFRTISIPLPGDDLAREVPYIWDLKELGIAPEDQYEFFIEVLDNDVVSGPKSARTQQLMVRLPSLEEVLADVGDKHERIEEELAEVVKESGEVTREMEELNRELLKNSKEKKLDWKEKKKAEDLIKKQAELDEKMQNLQKDLEQMTEQMQENQMLSPETMQKYQELQRLMQEVKAPELQQMQQDMNKMLEQASPDQMKQAMEQAKFDEEEFKKNVERTLNLLKKIKAEQKTDALQKMAEKMAKDQEELNKQMQNTNPADKKAREELAKKQEALQEQLESVEQEMDDLEKLMEELGGEKAREMLDKARQELDMNQTRQDMEKAKEGAKEGEFNKAGKSQQNAQKNLQNFAKQMQQMKQQMQSNQLQEAMKTLEKAITDILELSEKQEQLKSGTQDLDYNSTQLPEQAKKQGRLLEGLNNVAKTLAELGQKSFAITPQMAEQIGSALRSMQNAVKNLAERQVPATLQAQSNAMRSLNQSVQQMQNMLAAMQQSGSSACQNPQGGGQGQGTGGQGFMQKLQQVAMQQQGINMAMRQMSSGKMSQQQQAEFSRLTSEQGRAQQSMEELAKEERQTTSGSGRKRSGGNLEKIGEDMKEVLKDMQSGNVRPETIRRQEEILSRLLDATESVHERDYEKKREAKSGKNYNRKSPAELDLSTTEGKNRALRELLKSASRGYTRDYEEMIRRYFEALREQ
ncbi:MAG: DUF4175 family protein [Candidatus Kapaibacterium sp.]